MNGHFYIEVNMWNSNHDLKSMVKKSCMSCSQGGGAKVEKQKLKVCATYGWLHSHSSNHVVFAPWPCLVLLFSMTMIDISHESEIIIILNLLNNDACGGIALSHDSF